jgi:hypothetical protein
VSKGSRVIRVDAFAKYFFRRQTNIEPDVVFHGLSESDVEISMSVVLIRKIDEIQYEQILFFKNKVPDPLLRILVTGGLFYIGADIVFIQK